MVALLKHLSERSDKYGTANTRVVALGKSSANGHTAVILALLDVGVNVNGKDDFGLTALIRAS